MIDIYYLNSKLTISVLFNILLRVYNITIDYLLV